MGGIDLIIERPVWLWALIPVIGMIAAVWLFSERRTRYTVKTITLTFISCVIGILLVLLGAGLSVSTVTDKQSTVILLDLSESTEDEREDMLLYCEALLAGLDKRETAGVLAFAGNSVFFPRQTFSADSPKLKKLKTGSTDIADALKKAAAETDKHRVQRLILISDGCETGSDAAYTAGQLAGKQVHIDTIPVSHGQTPENEVQINNVTSEGGGFSGKAIILHVRMQSASYGSGTLTVREGDRTLYEEKITIGNGEWTYNASFEEEEPGLHVYSVTVSSDKDTDPRNNEGFAAVETCARPNVLILTSDTSDADTFCSLLSEKADVTVVKDTDAPKKMQELCRYDCIYLMNVDAAGLPEDFGNMLDQAVRVFGKHVCYVGGSSTFSHGNMDDTIYEAMQPVDFGAVTQDAAIVLVLDCSGSMNGGSLELAKTGAIKMLDSLHDGMSVGVISFQGIANKVVPLTKLNEKSRKKITDAIGKIYAGGGTNYMPALRMAFTMLTDADAEGKNVIFLSDGAPSENDNEIIKMVDKLNQRHIKVNTIGITSPFFVKDPTLGILDRMAKAGDGTVQYVSNTLELPKVLLGQAVNLSEEYSFSESVIPVIAKKAKLTEGLGTLPRLDGYVGLHAKDGAIVYISTDEGDPIYAVWEIGSGTVSTFASDLSDTWCSEWLADDSIRTFTLDAMAACLPKVRYDSSIKHSITTEGLSAVLTAELPFGDNDSDLVVTIDGKENMTLYPERVSGTVYRTEFMLSEPGEYRASIVMRQRGHILDETATVFALSYSGEYDAFFIENAPLMTTLSDLTGGLSTNDVSALTEDRFDDKRTHTMLTTLLCVLVTILFFAEIMIRKFTVYDFKRYYEIITGRIRAFMKNNAEN